VEHSHKWSATADRWEHLRNTFMNNTDRLHRAVDDAKDQAVAALENVKAQAIATADEIGRATRKTMHHAQGATEEVWSNAGSRAKNLRSKVVGLHARTAGKYNHDSGCCRLHPESGSAVFGHQAQITSGNGAVFRRFEKILSASF
jgi:hypothetical protein